MHCYQDATRSPQRLGMLLSLQVDDLKVKLAQAEAAREEAEAKVAAAAVDAQDKGRVRGQLEVAQVPPLVV